MKNYKIFIDHDYIEGGYQAYRFIILPETPVVGDLIGFECPRCGEDKDGNEINTTEQEQFDVVKRLWNEDGSIDIMVEGYYGLPDLDIMDDSSIEYHAGRFRWLKRDGWKIKTNRFMRDQIETINNAKA